MRLPLITKVLFDTWLKRFTLASIGPLLEFGFRFARTILLSRLLAPNEFGVAIAITVVISIAEQISDVGLNQIVLLEPASERGHILAAAHWLQIARGLLLSVGLVGVSMPIASLFGVSDNWPSFAVAALFPLVRSFGHLGVRQVQRDFDYRPVAICTATSSFAGLAAALIAVSFIRDHRVILIAFGCEALVYVALSHALASKPYEYKDHAALNEVLRFGLPLILNGAALAVVSQADRMLVGAVFGVEILGVYAVVMNLALTPISFIFQIFGGFGISMLLRSEDDRTKQNASIIWLIWFFALLGLLYSMFVGLSLDVLTPLIFGRHYTVPATVHALVTFITFLRVFNGAPTSILLSSRHTIQLVSANLMGTVGLLAAVLFIHFYPTLVALLIGILLGDLLSSVVLQRAVFNRLQYWKGYIFYYLAVAVSSVVVSTTLIVLMPEPTWTNRIIIGLLYLPSIIVVILELGRWWKLRSFQSPSSHEKRVS